jgi:glycopeptide antibiotics resistance protein
MRDLFKKLLVILPVALLTAFYLKAHYRDEYRHAATRRLVLFVLTILLLYGWMFLNVALWKQRTAFSMLAQSSFFVYVFMVLTLTGYFILFREVSTHGWWSNMEWRVQHKDHVNLKPFQVFKIYKISDIQIVGNFIMLLPLGIYLPVLYRRMNNFLHVFLVCMLASISIEVLQLATKFRSADVDDVILNTTGAVIGFGLWKLFSSFTLSAQPGKSKIASP